MGMMRFFASLTGCMLLLSAASALRAAEFPSCSLGRVSERVAPQYPLGLDGRIVEGTVQVQANFAPDGRVTSSKVISGPAALRFESEAYIRGWRAEKSEELRACVISIQYVADSSRGLCSKQNEVHLRAERLDETHVLVHLSCEMF